MQPIVVADRFHIFILGEPVSMVSIMISVGWMRGNVMSFVTAVVLSRHKMKTQGCRIEPFIFGRDTIVCAVAERRSLTYVIGAFEGDEIDALIALRKRVTVIGKVFDPRYNGGKKRIGTVIIYPVPHNDGARGFEYLVALTMYFDIDEDERNLFTMLARRRVELGKVLSVTEAWMDAFRLLTSFEVVDKPTEDDIDRVLNYVKNAHRYAEKLEAVRSFIERNKVVETDKVIVIDAGSEDPRKIAEEALDYKQKILSIAVARNVLGTKIVVRARRLDCKEIGRRIASMVNGRVYSGRYRSVILVPQTSPEAVIEILKRIELP